MTTDVLRLQGDYLVQTSRGGVITLDVGASGNTGTVIINGNLTVLGSQSSFETTNSQVKDNTITLNSGDQTTAINGAVTAGTAGIKIARGTRDNPDADRYAAFLEWNDQSTWQGFGAISQIQGLYEFRVGRSGRPQYSALKFNAIRLDENSASTGGTGAGQGPRLSIFGSDNPLAVMSVKGTSNYELRVTDDDDIPNKRYVDLQLNNAQESARAIVIGKSYVTLTDTYEDGINSEILGVLNGNPDSLETERVGVTSGTVVMRITEQLAQFSGVQFVDNQIEPVATNANLILTANGSGQVVLAAPLLFTTGNVPTPIPGQAGLYTGDIGGGGTGMYFNKKDLFGEVTQDEFVSRKKALIYSIIFG
jgi:hypothetical protein